jgi:hypothetical protein
VLSEYTQKLDRKCTTSVRRYGFNTTLNECSMYFVADNFLRFLLFTAVQGLPVDNLLSYEFTVLIYFSSDLLVSVNSNDSVAPASSSYTSNNLTLSYFGIGINDFIGFSILSFVPVVKAWIIRELSWIVNVTPNITGIQIFRCFLDVYS